MPWRKAKSLRGCLSLALVFTLLSMSLPHAAMAMPMAQGATPSMPLMHGQAQMAAQVAADPAASHNDQHTQCHCGAHCGMCGVCHSTLSTAMISSFIGVGVTPAGPRLSNLAEVYLSPDPHPPRA